MFLILNFLLIAIKLIHHSELQKLHKQFVIGGVLTESEFWATRKVTFLIIIFFYFFNFALDVFFFHQLFLLMNIILLNIDSCDIFGSSKSHYRNCLMEITTES